VTPVALRRLGSVTSTQDLLHELAAGGAPAGTALVAGEQTAGRGSRGRSWTSPVGGLWLSVLCRPAAAPAVEVLSLRVGLGVAAALERILPGLAIQLKWPNDLLLGKRKLGGVLCEARWQGGTPGWVAVGLGLNVANPIPAELAEVALTLTSAFPGASPEALAEPLARAIAAAGEGSGPLDSSELEAFRLRDALLGRHIVAPLDGVAEGLTPEGALRVRRADQSLELLRSGTVQPADQ